MSKAKWIMGGLGFVLGGPIGALIGVLLGSLYEGFSSGDIDQFDTSSEQVRQKATEKFRAVNEAYEHIKALRNMK